MSDPAIEAERMLAELDLMIAEELPDAPPGKIIAELLDTRAEVNGRFSFGGKNDAQRFMLLLVLRGIDERIGQVLAPISARASQGEWADNGDLVIHRPYGRGNIPICVCRPSLRKDVPFIAAAANIVRALFPQPRSETPDAT